MFLKRSDFLTELASQRCHVDPRVRAVGDNLAFEENVAPARGDKFEDRTAGMPLRAALANYFHAEVEGISRSHIPCTFRAENAAALMSSSIEPNQKVARLVRLDDALSAVEPMTYADLEAAVHRRDDTVIAPLLRRFNEYPNARPAFAAFAVELADDLAAPDWAFRLVTRLGLEHHLPPAGERWHFGLLTYAATDVFAAAGRIAKPFAVPTTLDSGGNPWFFPAPRDSGVGYVVDLDPPLARDLAREFLHVRIELRPAHLVRVGSVTGPDTRSDVPPLRNGHLARVRSVAARPHYAEMMNP